MSKPEATGIGKTKPGSGIATHYPSTNVYYNVTRTECVRRESPITHWSKSGSWKGKTHGINVVVFHTKKKKFFYNKEIEALIWMPFCKMPTVQMQVLTQTLFSHAMTILCWNPSNQYFILDTFKQSNRGSNISSERNIHFVWTIPSGCFDFDRIHCQCNQAHN